MPTIDTQTDPKPENTEISIGGGSFQIKPLNSQNWLLWKRKMLAILGDLDLEDIITTSPPDEKNEKEYKIWKKRDAKARMWIELAVGNSKMIHLLGPEMAMVMWDQLRTVKESRGRLGILTHDCPHYGPKEEAGGIAPHGK